METSDFPNQKRFFGLVVAFGLLVCAVPLAFTALGGNPLLALFEHGLTGPALLAVIVWAFAAMAVRRIVVGKLPESQPLSTALLLWGGSRLGFLLAVAILLVAWLVALAVDWNLARALGGSLFSVLVVAGFVKIIGLAVMESARVVRRWRSRSSP